MKMKLTIILSLLFFVAISFVTAKNETFGELGNRDALARVRHIYKVKKKKIQSKIDNCNQNVIEGN